MDETLFRWEPFFLWLQVAFLLDLPGSVGNGEYVLTLEVLFDLRINFCITVGALLLVALPVELCRHDSVHLFG